MICYDLLMIYIQKNLYIIVLMKGKQFHNKEILCEIKNSLSKRQNKLRSYQNQSFQQYLFYNSQALHHDLIDTLISLNNQNNIETSILDNITKKHNKYSSSLLSYCLQISNIYDSSKTFTFSHKNYITQSILLALFISKTKKAPVSLVISNYHLSRCGHMFASQNEQDKFTYTKNALQKEKINLLDLDAWNNSCYQPKSSQVIIVDCFGLNVVDYYPFLLKNKDKISQNKLFIYHNHLQGQDINQVIKMMKIDALNLQLHAQHAIQSIYEPSEDQAINKLIQFLKEDANHPENKDIIIFYPLQVHKRKYTSRLQQNIFKAGIKEHVNILNKPHKKQLTSKNNIIICDGFSTLIQWNYDYSDVIYVIDYGKQINFTFNYQYQTYVRQISLSTSLEKAKRISLVGSNKIGRYVYLQKKVRQNICYQDQVKELSSYIFKMIDYQLFQYIDLKNSRIKQCLTLLEQRKIIKQREGKHQIIDQRLLEKAKHKISPLQAALIYKIKDNSNLSAQEKSKLLNLMIMALIAIKEDQNLRQGKQQIQAAGHIKPNGIWRKSGYIQSCLEILTKCELIQNRETNLNEKSKSFRKNTSKMNENDIDIFGCLFQQPQPKKKTFKQMQIPDLIKQYTLNEDFLNKIRQIADDYRNSFEVDQMNIILDHKDISQILRLYLQQNKNAVAIYSGSKRYGYMMNGEYLFPHKTSLIYQLNQNPQFLLILRLFKYEKEEVLMCNSMNSQLYLEAFGQLPPVKKISQSQMEIQFHGISTSTFQRLWKNNGIEIVQFENKYECFVQSNQEMALIIIHCIKEKAAQIKQNFDAILSKIRSKLSVSNKIAHYIGNTNLLLGVGGAIQQIIKSDYINKCILSNLHLEVSKEDLQELFEDFINTKEITMRQPQNGKFYKSALIQFHSQRDYYNFHESFNELIYYDRVMDIKPLKDEQSAKIINSKQYIEFKWYVWKSHKKALVRFATEEGALAAIKAFENNPELDGVKVKVSLEGCSVTIDQLNIYTDQIYIQQALINYGQIKDIQILKTPLKQKSSDVFILQNIIKNVKINNVAAQINFKMEAVQKLKNGLRVCRVNIPNADHLKHVSIGLNKTIGNIGQGRLYAKTWFQEPVIVPYGSLQLYQQILEETILQCPEKPNIQFYIQNSATKKLYLVLKSCLKTTIDLIYINFTNKLQGYPIVLSQYQKSILLTDIGFANIIDLQEKYNCKLIVNIQAKNLKVLIIESKLEKIKDEIRNKIDDNFFYRISLNSKAFKYFKEFPNKIAQIKANYSLSMIQLQPDSKGLLLQSSALNVQKAFNYLMHFIQSLSVPSQEMINADVCGICCQEPHRPYRLQSCSHKFCRDCVLDYVNSALGDASLFPLKCPHCFVEIVMDDLQSLLEPAHWQKLYTIAVNQYVSKKGDIMTYCYTAGCKQVNMIKAQHFSCDVCLMQYCLSCKMRHHPGITCAEAKLGGDELFLKYMKDNNVRTCPNKLCKIPVDRIDGCYRVTCSRCNKSMCFKCPADKMIAYDDYNLCYAHLNQVHGGYW